jgi:hypothetical protein
MERDARDALRRAGRSALAVVAALAAVPLVAADPPTAAPRAAIQGYRIDDWKALSNGTLMIRTNDGRRFRATLMGPCIGLKVTETIAFVTRGERTVDRFAGIMLPDGTRCYFKTLEAVSQPTDSRDEPGLR